LQVFFDTYYLFCCLQDLSFLKVSKLLKFLRYIINPNWLQKYIYLTVLNPSPTTISEQFATLRPIWLVLHLLAILWKVSSITVCFKLSIQKRQHYQTRKTSWKLLYNIDLIFYGVLAHSQDTFFPLLISKNVVVPLVEVSNNFALHRFDVFLSVFQTLQPIK